MRFCAVTKFVMLAPDGAFASPDVSSRGGGGPSHRHDRRLGRRRCARWLGSRLGRDRSARRSRDWDSGRDLRRVSPLSGVPRLTTAVTSPRPAPQVFMPVIAGTVLIALALPIFIVAGWPIDGWVIAATLWVASQIFGYLLVRMRLGGNLAASGVVAVSDPWVGLAAALTYALAYTVELVLSLVSYFGNPPL